MLVCNFTCCKEHVPTTSLEYPYLCADNGQCCQDGSQKDKDTRVRCGEHGSSHSQHSWSLPFVHPSAKDHEAFVANFAYFKYPFVTEIMTHFK